ncbi:MAG: twin-arginine translocase TatA/TatE family subunit [Bacteroidota bacterium]
MKSLLLFGLGTWEIVLIVLIILIFFGAKRIPELARGLGKGIREFKDATKEIKDEIEDGAKDDSTKKSST